MKQHYKVLCLSPTESMIAFASHEHCVMNKQPIHQNMEQHSKVIYPCQGVQSILSTYPRVKQCKIAMCLYLADLVKLATSGSDIHPLLIADSSKCEIAVNKNVSVFSRFG